LVSLPVLAGQTSTGPKNGTILIIRHAEKPPENDPSPLLTSVGNERAQKYIAYFQSFQIGSQAASPDFVFASRESKHSDRPWLTVKPLVEALKLPHDHSIEKDDIAQLAARLRSREGDGKTVLVCWHHGEIPALLAALGADTKALLGAESWNKDVFGWVIELQYDAHGDLQKSSAINEHLMADDTFDPPGAGH
jgi:hypothetical protein